MNEDGRRWHVLGAPDATSETEKRLAKVLGEHEPYGGMHYCDCTPQNSEGYREPLDCWFDEHLAQAIIASDALAPLLDQARADAVAPVLALADKWDEQLRAELGVGTDWTHWHSTQLRAAVASHQEGGA